MSSARILEEHTESNPITKLAEKVRSAACKSVTDLWNAFLEVGEMHTHPSGNRPNHTPDTTPSEQKPDNSFVLSCGKAIININSLTDYIYNVFSPRQPCQHIPAKTPSAPCDLLPVAVTNAHP